MTLDEPEVIRATRSPHGYLASPLSDNISVREDGSLIIVGCPIARTGWQTYSVGDLPRDRAVELGVDVANPSASIELYRPASEVFAPEFLASLNGIAVTDNHPPGGEFVNKDNFAKYAKGHIQNARKGPEPLEDGEWPVVADIIISGEPLVGKVLNKVAREISLGYDFGIDRDGDKIIQCDMLANHNAVVPKGRAGDFVRIEDAAPEEVSPPIESPTASVEVIEAERQPIRINFKALKEKPTVDMKNKLFRLLMGKHFIEMARATDADPEKVMEAVEALQEEPPAAVVDKRSKTKDEEEVIPPKNTQENEFESEASDRKRLHDALDRMLDEEEPVMDRRKAKDADIEELKALLDEFLDEEAAEPEHAEDDEEETDPEELEAALAEDCPDCGMAMDECECPGEEVVESGEEVMDGEEGESPDPDSDDDQEDVEPAEDRKRAADRARGRAVDGAAAVLRMMRPVIAKSGDKKVQNAFNRALDSVKKSSRPTSSAGGYGRFAAAARARDERATKGRARTGDAGDPNSKLQSYYNDALKGGK